MTFGRLPSLNQNRNSSFVSDEKANTAHNVQRVMPRQTRKKILFTADFLSSMKE